MGQNFDDYPGLQPMRSWANTYAQPCNVKSRLGYPWVPGWVEGSYVNITDPSYGEFLEQQINIWNRNNNYHAHERQQNAWIPRWERNTFVDITNPRYGKFLTHQANIWNQAHGIAPLEKDEEEDDENNVGGHNAQHKQ